MEDRDNDRPPSLWAYSGWLVVYRSACWIIYVVRICASVALNLGRGLIFDAGRDIGHHIFRRFSVSSTRRYTYQCGIVSNLLHNGVLCWLGRGNKAPEQITISQINGGAGSQSILRKIPRARVCQRFLPSSCLSVCRYIWQLCPRCLPTHSGKPLPTHSHTHIPIPYIMDTEKLPVDKAEKQPVDKADKAFQFLIACLKHSKVRILFFLPLFVPR